MNIINFFLFFCMWVSRNTLAERDNFLISENV